MFREQISSADFHHMPREYQELLTRVLMIQADCEIGGPHVYGSRWLLDAPTADDMHCLSRIIGDEIDHFRKINALLREISKDGTPLLHRKNSERFLDAFKVEELPTWAEVAVFCFLVDRVGRHQLEEFVDSTYIPLNEAIPGIIQEEFFHVSYGEQKMKELCGDSKSRKEAQQAVRRWYPLALDMFGRSGSRRSERYLEWGLKRRTNVEARQAFIDEVNPLIVELGLDVPDEMEGRAYL
ncbi:MAG: ring oxydation complex/ phenylacetic acid degradation [Deltaproteobacteria bacterium]|nr:ring oxydation complex/ phenylacetic acid degradation [Deltaproteobacteria bacterium]